MRTRAVVALAAVTLGAGCGEPGDDDTSRAAQVYIAAIREVMVDQPPPAEPDTLPLVFVVATGEEEIDADVQAEVIEELHEDAELKFADHRRQVVVAEQDGLPVRDDGLLIAVGDVGDGDPVAVEVEVYRSDDDSSRRVLTIGRSSSQWTVTSSSVLPAGDA